MSSAELAASVFGITTRASIGIGFASVPATSSVVDTG